MTSAEERYAQIEKEALSIAYFLERFHQYTYGRQVTVENDHRPLESIVKKPLHKAPRRLQNLLLRILIYDTTVIWKPGSEVPIADLLSRAYLNTDSIENSEGKVSMIEHLALNEGRIASIKEATAKDTSLLMQVLMRGWPDTKNEVPDGLQPYFSYRDELTAQDGIIFRGERIIIPQSLHAEMKKKVHAGHLGINSDLVPLNVGDHVTMQPYGPNRTWLQATVKKYLGQRTYLVHTATGKDLKRNRVHLSLRPNPGDSTSVHDQPFPVPRSGDSTSVQPIVQPDVIPEDPDVPSEDTPRKTSSGRTIKPPMKLDL